MWGWDTKNVISKAKIMLSLKDVMMEVISYA